MGVYRSFIIITLGLCLACGDYDDDVQPVNSNRPNTESNISQIVNENNQTDSLELALAKTGLSTTFQSKGNFTLLAPSNQAFATYISSDPSVDRISDIDNSKLTNIIQYHILNQEFSLSDLKKEKYIRTLNTQAPGNEETVLRIDTMKAIELNKAARVLYADVKGSNGLVHIIDNLLSPLHLLELVQTHNQFDSLTVALKEANLTTTLQASGPFTVFAPTNQAFIDLLATDGTWNQIADIPTSNLTSILSYHINNQLNLQADQLRDGQSISTLNSATLSVSHNNGLQLVTSSAQDINLTEVDMQGTNGVIHTIDKVMLP